MQINPARLFGDLKIGTRLALGYGAFFLLLMVALAYVSYLFMVMLAYASAPMRESNEQAAATVEALNSRQELATNVAASSIDDRPERLRWTDYGQAGAPR